MQRSAGACAWLKRQRWALVSIARRWLPDLLRRRIEKRNAGEAAHIADLGTGVGENEGGVALPGPRLGFADASLELIGHASGA